MSCAKTPQMLSCTVDTPKVLRPLKAMHRNRKRPEHTRSRLKTLKNDMFLRKSDKKSKKFSQGVWGKLPSNAKTLGLRPQILGRLCRKYEAGGSASRPRGGFAQEWSRRLCPQTPGGFAARPVVLFRLRTFSDNFPSLMYYDLLKEIFRVDSFAFESPNRRRRKFVQCTVKRLSSKPRSGASQKYCNRFGGLYDRTTECSAFE